MFFSIRYIFHRITIQGSDRLGFHGFLDYQRISSKVDDAFKDSQRLTYKRLKEQSPMYH